jgi:hypothetical protein
MSNGGIIDVGTSAAQAIGRYFSVISVIPSSLYVTFVYLLIESGSWEHSPDWNKAFTSFEHIGIGGIGALAFLSIGLGLVIHPIQFALVQFLEGYWGTGSAVQSIRVQRILYYQRLCRRLRRERVTALKQLENLPNQTTVDSKATRARLISQRAEALRISDYFPRRTDDIMPTRLGNMLRRYESQAGSQYGMDALQVVPHLLSIAPADHVDYVGDQRSQLDLAVRMTFISLAASATTVLFLWPYGLWILVAAIPYLLAYLSYRGSVVAAGHYGAALDTLINLDRFMLYEQLHLPLPVDTTDERLTNKRIKRLFEYNVNEIVSYKHPVQGDATSTASKLRLERTPPQASLSASSRIWSARCRQGTSASPPGSS